MDGSIQSIKGLFKSSEVLAVYSDCIYMPTEEKLNNRAYEFMTNSSISIYWFYKISKIVGVIVIKQTKESSAEIVGIAVHSNHRKEGIGGRLIQFVCEELSITELSAETDDEAIGFYKKCGFVTEEFLGNGNYKRFKCFLTVYWFVYIASKKNLSRSS